MWKDDFMQWRNDQAETFVPLGISDEEALKQTTHLAIGAHSDDLEFMCWHGILQCFRRPSDWFTGVTVTSGSGSPRTGSYADMSDQQMIEVRLREGRTAALVGEYSALINLMYESVEVRRTNRPAVISELEKVLEITRPRVLYTHNLLDKHTTHLGIATAVVEAARNIDYTPERFLGCEVWRGLDWVPESRKIVLDVSERPALTQSFVGVFDSQIAGGKRYDLAAGGRKRANATFFDAYQEDKVSHLEYALDMMPLLEDPGLSFADYALSYLDEFKAGCLEALKEVG